MSESPWPVHLAFDLPGSHPVTERPTLRVSRTNIPFAGIVNVVLPLIRQRTQGPIFHCFKCRLSWSAAILAVPHRCPNACDHVLHPPSEHAR